MNNVKNNNLIKIYLIVISFIALGCAFSESVFSNYFKDVYDVSAMWRGFIEIPRETPGIIAIFIIAALSRVGDIKMIILAQFLSFIGILALGLSTPNFFIMLIMLFVFSLGIHIYLPLQDTLAISILSEENLGKSMGKIKGVSTFFTLTASVIIFVGFKVGFFNFDGNTHPVYIVSAICFFIAIVFLIILLRKTKGLDRPVVPTRLLFRKKYIYYYMLTIMNGVQKQIVFVYAPWVVIDILQKGADTISMLLIISSLFGMFFLPFLGRCIDKYGIRTMLFADAWSFIAIYLAFAFMSYNLYVGNFAKSGIAVLIVFILFITDRMSSQMSIVKTLYLYSITDDKSEILPTMSLGISLDHIVAITCSFISGIIWESAGPHYIFIIAASFSLVNLVIAKIVPLNEQK